MDHNLPKTIKSILKQREILIVKGFSRKNTMQCLKLIKNIKNQIEAHQSIWDGAAWKRFFIRNESEIIFLIPENKAGLTIKQKIYENL